MNRHQEMAGKASSIIKFVEQCSSSASLEVRDYLKAIEELCSMQLDFKDVELFLFKPELNVVLNLIGLHYCINWLGVPVSFLSSLHLLCNICRSRRTSLKIFVLAYSFSLQGK